MRRARNTVVNVDSTAMLDVNRIHLYSTPDREDGP